MRLVSNYKMNQKTNDQLEFINLIIYRCKYSFKNYQKSLTHQIIMRYYSTDNFNELSNYYNDLYKNIVQ